MAVNYTPVDRLEPISGIRFASIHSGIKKPSILDLVAIGLCDDSKVSAIFTTNKFCAAPVTVAKEHLAQSLPIKCLLINSGNANAGTGAQGLKDAKNSCQAVANELDCEPTQVLPFSTGVIAAALPLDKIEAAVPRLISQLSDNDALEAAKGILTTDTVLKACSKQIVIEGETLTITGFTKGSGMIQPNMATMLAYIFTDADIDLKFQDQLLKNCSDQSFNSITVDGDTSTNDACVLVNTGQKSYKVTESSVEYIQVLMDVFQNLAQSIIRDAEGATKFVSIHIKNAESPKEAKILGLTIAHSPLVKTALFASDPNWGRILAAIGRAPIESLDINKVDLFLGSECLVKQGNPNPSYSEANAFEIMKKEEIDITVNLNMGDSETTIWTSDLTYEYVKINAEYRS